MVAPVRKRTTCVRLVAEQEVTLCNFLDWMMDDSLDDSKKCLSCANAAKRFGSKERMRLVQSGRNDPMSQRPVFQPTVANTMHAPTIANDVHDLMPDGRRLCAGVTEGSKG